MGIVFALFASFFQAAGYVSLKKSYQELQPSVAFLYDAVFGLVIWIPFALIVGFDFSHLPLVLLFAFISAVLSEAFVFYVFSKGEVSITGTIFSSYPIYTILFSFFINNERLTSYHWLFVALTIVGILTVSFPERISKSEFRKKAIILWGLAGALAVGFSDSLSKNVIDRTSAQAFLFALAFAQLPVALTYLRLEKQPLSQFKQTIEKFDKYKYAILGSFMNIVAVLFLWLAFQETLASIASPLTATYPAIILILAYLFLKERISRKDLLGLSVIIIGVIGIGYFY